MGVISATGLSMIFGSNRALDDLDVEVRQGVTGLVGANGAGKTTFIRMVTGYLLPSAGTVEVLGASPAADPDTVQRSLGFVMETSRLYPELSVASFLRFCGGARGLRGPALAEAVDRSVERFQLESVRGRLVGHLSKGFQQRVSLAQAFLHDPPLVIVDEPTGGLDPLQRGEVQELLRGLRGERTVLLCTHDLHEARQLASRVAVLNSGRLVAQGAPDALLDRDGALDLFRGGSAAP